MTPDTNQTVLADAKRIEVRNAALEEAYEAAAFLYASYYQHLENQDADGILQALKLVGNDIRALKTQAHKDGAQSTQNQPEIRASIESTGGALAPAPMSTTSMSPTSGDVALPPMPDVVMDKLTGPQILRAEKWARAAVLADRQRRATGYATAYREAVAHLETIASFGGTVQQAKDLAAKGLERGAAALASQKEKNDAN